MFCPNNFVELWYQLRKSVYESLSLSLFLTEKLPLVKKEDSFKLLKDTSYPDKHVLFSKIIPNQYLGQNNELQLNLQNRNNLYLTMKHENQVINVHQERKIDIGGNNMLYNKIYTCPQLIQSNSELI